MTVDAKFQLLKPQATIHTILYSYKQNTYVDYWFQSSLLLSSSVQMDTRMRAFRYHYQSRSTLRQYANCVCVFILTCFTISQRIYDDSSIFQHVWESHTWIFHSFSYSSRTSIYWFNQSERGRMNEYIGYFGFSSCIFYFLLLLFQFIQPMIVRFHSLSDHCLKVWIEIGVLLPVHMFEIELICNHSILSPTQYNTIEWAHNRFYLKTITIIQSHTYNSINGN